MSVEHITIYKCERCRKTEQRPAAGGGGGQPDGWVGLQYVRPCLASFEASRRVILCNDCDPLFMQFLDGIMLVSENAPLADTSADDYADMGPPF